ncbi:MAG: preprotein translocase subunit SecY [Candidatus Andersenbacteria bacterium RIFCSPLOWO2_12_FULL_45_8]|nr:MAG: Protein translocase subunit SecY [Parcubacteria group bacterium GW2011_GWA2_45_14]OGY35638.1 MAG: preprotein translocase subunit SecY [Candidatus Andersenbacteria bacterium RIFCSPHIGHO2_02_FULL_46_16]OGY36841.1 MAG: preprotein translocase subunit SecY [Candidatus Andersenbacteria bacterium RIFCSPLOWO2_02_FULL_46_11]OGY41640.1 MAG: preprotein translocase subunit SecY [Candidatus Andersenbacteria bacterium RIFCSPLOWO2_12_FULL_45_8]HBE90199.1 preprotein translocase subunit SecY [Candidatus
MFNWKKILQVWRVPELRKKLLAVLGLLIVFRVSAIIPLPGVPRESLEAMFGGNQLFGLLDIFSGGGLSNLSIVMLGVGPYITASIVMQLLTMIVPRLEEMAKEEGDAGRRRINQWTRFLTVPLAGMQAFGFINILIRQGVAGGAGFSFSPWEMTVAVLTVIFGTVFLMWLGELITEQGVGNGISLIIFVGIIARLPVVTAQALATFTPDMLLTYGSFLIVSLVVIAGVVVITEGQRAIPVSYAKRIRGSRVFGGASTHLPLRVNQAGVIPIIFALSIMLFPGVIANFLVGVNNQAVARSASWVVNLFQDQWFYGITYFVLVVVFTYFYTSVTFDPNNIAENLQKQGGFVPGIRPGRRTANFLKYVINRITLTGAIFLGLIAVLPLVTQGLLGVATLTIGGTALLIVVSVVLETMKQLESQLTMREYEGFLS